MCRFGVGLAFALCTQACAFAQRLPLKTYTTADGLSSNSIHWIVPDSRGFVWFCTAEGLSRFDGRQFTNFGREHGLPDVDVYDLLETRRGEYWVAVAGGVCRLKPASREAGGHFEVYRPEGISSPPVMTSLAEDPDGSIWCGSDDGVFRLSERGGAWEMKRINLGGVPAGTSAQSEISAFLGDRSGNLWIAAFSGLYRRSASGRIDRFAAPHGLPGPYATALLNDSRGTVWVGTAGGLCRLRPDPQSGGHIVDRVYTTHDGLPGNYIRTLLEPVDGSLWVGTLSGLARSDWIRNPSTAAESFSAAQGLRGADVPALARDRDGNVWIGSTGGATRVARSGFLTFDEAAGLHSSNAVSIFENREGEVCAVTLSNGRQVIHRFDGRRFLSSGLKLTEGAHLTGRSASQIALQDRTGGWWFVGGGAILRFPSVSFESLSRSHPLDSFTNAEGGGVAFRMYEDSLGGIWMSYSSWTRHGLGRWDRATGTFKIFSERDGLPGLGVNLPWVFTEDRHGNVWVGMSQNGLARYRDGRFRHFGPTAGRVRSLHVDGAGRLWAGWGSNGVVRIDDPGAVEPDFRKVYSRGHGLAGDVIHSIAEDREGRIYLGLSGGVDRLDPEAPAGSGRVDHFTEADGLAAGIVQAAYRDRSGVLWFGTPGGLSRFVPETRREQRPPPVFITGLRSGDRRLPVSEVGERRVSALRFQPEQKYLEVEFVAPYYAGETLGYQSKLEGADRDWGALSSQRSVNYANLAPGNYQFLVRAVTARGQAGDPASVVFEVLPPVWRRWWFLTMAAACTVAAAGAAHRYRVNRLVELERVRVRIATDLHDDIGSGLSQLAILSEHVRRRLDGAMPWAAEPLARIGAVSRELVDSMEDIVWSMNPARDSLQDLSRRMRQYASEVLESRGVDFELRAPETGRDIALDPGARRQLYLIFKEAIHNLRHSGCSKAVATLELRDGAVFLEISDNGGGLPTGDAPAGHGLASMRERARRLGGKLEIESNARGTAVRGRIPVGRSFLRNQVGDNLSKLD